ncbi:cadmium transporter [Alkalihalobacillus alcalophilus ATCC 27647 = CGMCC 1.3604]|uniref:Cd(2+)-exporting ATPase n=1 Tax=Alkalihalobacillus alcalophilus ATCC 27647 = CGMCC 1.3604 TaxID=1218173 RepID=J8TRG2_ALKAL|nr:heavy metal translocating P-type ATPase [Alkalihalobacillus alcalophilus]AFV25820.1 zinc/cadmium/cobalt ion transporter [Alkalihalobacillus alcalophilus ATCC 27647 = CGMCC 1.3604]KGA97985.1 cadmium transporter [Alkalihalobacillus alcalophilus ATCC 27647 = CGMCC 1.3604]MED1563988.1 heavy metal translocating P-type ATPase [Alkalihalobacillus alcalophilus]THG89631.1 cadmium transporter [Alkalihalobacillus alcalophilus ATCC 27647 = CGMCC 1.3604]
MGAIEKEVFRVTGLSCASCAATFEQNVKEIPGVQEAKVNFGASKITVIGAATVSEIEKAGAFDHIKVVNEKEGQTDVAVEKKPIWQGNLHVIFSALFVLLGLVLQFALGEESLITVFVFISAIIIGGYSLFMTGFKNLIRLRFDMKTLMTIAVIGAAIIGEWVEGSIVVILFAVSEALERFSMDKARQSIRSLMNIAPKEALIRRDGIEQVVNVKDIEIGDIMIVKPGQKLAMDGMVVSGQSSINEATITGESIPVEKTVKDEVFAGTLNEEGFLEVEVTKHVNDTTIAKIIHLVEEAQAERAPSQAFVDKFAKYYTPAIIVLAALIATIPPTFFGQGWEDWIYLGLAVLVVGCPCALVISTPVAIVTAIGNLAKHGVLVKGGVYLEATGALKAIAFDKTGTLTKGKPKVTDYIVYDEEVEQNQLFAKVAALESKSLHPLASAILERAEREKIFFEEIEISNFSSITGKGLKATIDSTEYVIGNLSLLKETVSSTIDNKVINDIEKMQSEGKTAILLGTSEQVLAVVGIADEVRSISQKAVKQLEELGIRETVMLTGDNQRTAEAVAKQVGVKEVRAELLPEDKLNVIKDLRQKYEHVAMVGDGVNDAPALAASSVGIAMGGAGTDTALETADLALMSDDLKKLPFTIKVSRKALAIIKQNIIFALSIKAIALLLVIPEWLTLWMAILADVGATLLVTLNGMRLMKMKDDDE